jgi:hypothetical protein
MKQTVAEQISGLDKLSRQELLDLWQSAYQKAAPSGIRREVMIPFLAYRIQENAFGGLKPSVRAELQRITRSLEGTDGRTQRPRRTRFKAGTRLVRRWRGEIHEVAVTEEGYAYRGAPYQSLSAVARLVTGTRWSGPAFFGLNKRSSSQAKKHA